MHILIIDSHAVLSEKQKRNTFNRLRFALARFAYRINSATMRIRHFDSGEVGCDVLVNVEGVGIISVHRSGDSLKQAVVAAVEAVEPRVACRIDWRSMFNVETFSTWLASAGQTLRWLLGIRPARSY